MSREGKQRLLWGGAVLAVCLGAILSRAFWDGRQALLAGDRAHAAAAAAAEAGDGEAALEQEREAIARWRRAARWYVPGAPHVRAAYDRLEALAAAAEQGGDRQLALEAWRAVRSSSLATRSFYTPESARLDRANQRIAALMAAIEDPALDPGQDEAARRDWHLALLVRDEAPSVGWSLLAVLGFFAWVGGGFYFAWRGLGQDDRLDRRHAVRAGVLVLVGLVVWMVALYQA